MSLRNLREPPTKFQIEKEIKDGEENLKRMWIALISKWVKISKDDFLIKKKYKVDFEDISVFQMEYIKDTNPNLIK